MVAEPPELKRDVARLAAVGLMTIGAVHDLGNIVQILSSGIRMVARHPRIRNVTALQAVVIDLGISVERATALIQQLLSFVRQESPCIEEVLVGECLVALERMLQWVLSEKVSLVVQICEDAPAILCNRHHLENAILNLALNARDAMPTGGTLSIAASAYRERRQVAGLLISVSDSGIGMAPEAVEQAFHPFFTTKADGLGTGLGLASVRAFAEEAGGCVTIKSAAGIGTTVTLRLPAAPDRAKSE